MRYKTPILTSVAAIAIILAINAISKMLFGSLGKTSISVGWSYVLTLYFFLAAIGISHYLSTANRSKYNWLSLISTLLSGALLGFFYGGSATDNNPQIAIVSAIAISILFGIAFWQKYQFVRVIVAFIASIAAYGFAFFAGTQVVSLLSVAKTIPGVIWSLLCLIYIVFTLSNFIAGISLIKKTR